MTYWVGHISSPLVEDCGIPQPGTGQRAIETHICRTPDDDRGEVIPRVTTAQCEAGPRRAGHLGGQPPRLAQIGVNLSAGAFGVIAVAAVRLALSHGDHIEQLFRPRSMVSSRTRSAEKAPTTPPLGGRGAPSPPAMPGTSEPSRPRQPSPRAFLYRVQCAPRAGGSSASGAHSTGQVAALPPGCCDLTRGDGPVWRSPPMAADEPSLKVNRLGRRPAIPAFGHIRMWQGNRRTSAERAGRAHWGEGTPGRSTG